MSIRMPYVVMCKCTTLLALSTVTPNVQMQLCREFIHTLYMLVLSIVTFVLNVWLSNMFNHLVATICVLYT